MLIICIAKLIANYPMNEGSGKAIHDISKGVGTAYLGIAKVVLYH